MLKILSSKVSVDSDITYMSAVKFIACLGVFAYLNLSKNPHLWTDTSYLKVDIKRRHITPKSYKKNGSNNLGPHFQPAISKNVLTVQAHVRQDCIFLNRRHVIIHHPEQRCLFRPSSGKCYLPIA